MTLPDGFDNGVGNVILECAECQGQIVRTIDPPHAWVHCDDFVQLPSLMTAYDHEPTPDVIDLEDPDELPEPARPKINPFPF